MAISENERHQLAMRVFDALRDTSQPGRQMMLLQCMMTLLTEEQLAELVAALEHPPAPRPVPQPVQKVFTPRKLRYPKQRS